MSSSFNLTHVGEQIQFKQELKIVDDKLTKTHIGVYTNIFSGEYTTSVQTQLHNPKNVICVRDIPLQKSPKNEKEYISFNNLPEKVSVKAHFEHASYLCEVREITITLFEEKKQILKQMGMRVSWLNGYVRIPKEHPCVKLCDNDADIPILVHGGITSRTYALDTDYFVLGFDTSHGIDGEEEFTVSDIEEKVKIFAEDLKKLEETH